MKKSFYHSLCLVAVLVLTGGIWETSAQEKAHTQESPSLYKRLGGYDALAAVTDDFVGRLVSDKQLTRFFNGVSTDSRKRIRQLVLDQLCAATGGPCLYIGRSMRASHEGLGITPWAERARAELRASGETVRRRTIDSIDRLTPQELQIADLAGHGASNPDIAAQLFLSRRTVEYHLRKVYVKLGISSRMELTELRK